MVLFVGMAVALLFCAAINVNSEHVVTLSQLAKGLPERRKARPVHPSTIQRWRHPGVKGVRLECVRIGGVWHTSLEAFQRFCDKLTALGPACDAPSADQPLRPGGAAGCNRHTAAHRDAEVERKLDDRGV